MPDSVILKLEEGGYRKDAGFGKREDLIDTGDEKGKILGLGFEKRRSVKDTGLGRGGALMGRF